MKYFVQLLSLLAFTAIVACSKPQDLDAPCPHFGRHCPQLPINVPMNESL